MRSALSAPALMIALATLGCAADAPSLAERLRECGLLDEGRLGDRTLALFHAPDACYRECLTGAGCEELEALTCRTSIGLAQRCDRRCAYECPDGALIAHSRVCDGIEHCEGGADEAGCSTFRCGDGFEIGSALVCDGVQHCGDASDERDCPGRFSCTAHFGGVITGDWPRCDGSEHCADGSDERDCPELVCDDGTRIVYPPGTSPVCDGWTRCPDGSDEHDCAMLGATCTAP